MQSEVESAHASAAGEWSLSHIVTLVWNFDHLIHVCSNGILCIRKFLYWKYFMCYFSVIVEQRPKYFNNEDSLICYIFGTAIVVSSPGLRMSSSFDFLALTIPCISLPLFSPPPVSPPLLPSPCLSPSPPFPPSVPSPCQRCNVSSSCQKATAKC